MQTYKLTQADINGCLLLQTINERKDYYGKPVPKFLSRFKKIVCNIFPRGGKTYMGLDCIKKLREVKPNSRICVVVPSDVIRLEWNKHLERVGVNNVYVYSVRTYVQDETILRQYDLFICDEAHKYLRDSDIYSKVIPITTCEYFLALSATLDAEMLAKLEKYGVKLNYHIPLETGYQLDVIPEYISYNIPVTLTLAEKSEYKQLQKEYANYIDLFSPFDNEDTAKTIINCVSKTPFMYNGKFVTSRQLASYISKKINKPTNNIVGYAVEFMSIMRQRSELLYKAKNKLELFYELIEKIPKNEKKIIFTYKTDFADDIVKSLPSSMAYHSKISAKNKKLVIEGFNNGTFNNIVSCKSLNEGFTTLAKTAIRMYFDSKVTNTVQSLGEQFAHTYLIR
jgi:superfamily II DNA or RNA helicase